MRFIKGLRRDIKSIQQRDPAARSCWQVLLFYPGVHALCAFRVANALWRRKLTWPAQIVSYIARSITGIEIHPGATIGQCLFIDHGFGVVIGETAEIADNVTLYQGVTLGGVALHKGKRHPTLHSGVIVGAGALVLGPVTIGENARIGANAVVLSNVAAGTTMVGTRARALKPADTTMEGFTSYGTSGDCDDPLAQQVQHLAEEIKALKSRI